MALQYVTFLNKDELGLGQREVFDVGNRSVLLMNIDGEFYAVENMCSHAEYELADGELDGCSLHCPQHGAAFDVRTGEALSAPAVQPIRIYPTRLDGDDVQVEVDVY